MSYSSHSHAAIAYREREVMAASPSRLVVIVFDHVLANLRRASTAASANNIQLRLEAIKRARAGVMELLVTLDAEKGGAIGTNLRALYGFVLTELRDEARHPDPKRLEQVTNIVAELRDAFATIIAAEPARVPAA